MTTRPHVAPSSAISRMARHGMPLVAIGTVGLVCGPGTAATELAHMSALGKGWRMAIDAWRLSGELYCFFLAAEEDDGATPAFARPIVYCTSDPAQLQRSIWSIASLQTSRTWLIDSLEPSMNRFVDNLKASERLSPGHA